MSTIIKLQRGPCFGPCPIYKVTIYDNGTVIYNGEEFVKTKGKHKINISKEKIRELMKQGYSLRLLREVLDGKL